MWAAKRGKMSVLLHREIATFGSVGCFMLTASLQHNYPDSVARISKFIHMSN
jgi:hypothetical protein